LKIGHYCNERYFDKDELYRHYRKDHYFCHFCDSDGYEEYYADYKQLRNHFLEHHHLCEIDGCSSSAETTHEYVVFRSDIDFQAHKKEKHAKSKFEAKTFGKLNIEFNMNRERGGPGTGLGTERGDRGSGRADRGFGRGSSNRMQNEKYLFYFQLFIL
jgi:E3 ubiquitin-protein ligase ZNF598